ncbi:hypothetical protein RHSIM_RhsimUnG0182300 [Rhododendron simsii]|uniref:Retroviral polymerase SH3-like domain-containing protein n=1 Tax=Rhododendron simsii TaxID=118357 RepID=A0A834FUG5_RHOSS|nr:hypothetical protein RHSIM_RhsimUnG0182300 [Rhododendron simsii]
MASETFAQPAIPRFDGHYDHWSMLMENFLRSKEYWTVVVSGVAEPAEGVVLTDAQKAELDGLKLKDLKAKNYLFQAIDRSILETILCKDSAKHIWDSMKKKSGIPKNFWPEAVNWSTHVLNRSPTLAVQNMTPEEAWSGQRPAVDHFRIFGCVAYAHIPDQKRKKLDDKGEKCIFLGVSDQSKAYKLYNPITKKILISRDVIFDEAQTWPWNTNVVGEQIPTSFDGENDDEANQSKQRLVPAIATLENPQNEAPMASEITPTTPEVDEQVEAAAGSRSHRVRKRPAWMSDYEVPGIDQSDDPLTHFALFSDCDPTVFESAMKDCNPVSIPSEFGLKLNKYNGGKMVDNMLFKQIVGSLMYLTATRPDIMHAVSVLSRYMERPTEFHLLAAKRVFRYLQGTKEFGLFYKKGEKSDLLDQVADIFTKTLKLSAFLKLRKMLGVCTLDDPFTKQDVETSWVGRRGTVLDAVHYMNFAFARIPRKLLGRRGFGDIENCYQDEKMKESIDPH